MWPFRKKDKSLSVIPGLSTLRHRATIIMDGTRIYKNRGDSCDTDPHELLNELPLDNDHLILVIHKEALKRP